MKNKAILLALTLLLTITFNPALAEDATKISIPPIVRIDAARVTLGDIAKITNAPAGEMDKLRDLYIARAPRPGQHIRLSRNILERKLKRLGFAPSSLSLEMPRYVSIHGSGEQIDGDRIVKAARDFLAGDKSSPSPESLRLIQKPSSVGVPPGKIDIKCQKAEVTSPMATIIDVEISCDGKRAAGRRVFFKHANKIPQPANEGVARASEGRDEGGTSRVREGKTSRSRKSGKAIRRGDPLEITVTRKNLVITLMGEAGQNGSVGETIRVKADGGKKSFKALLVDERRAVIELN